MGASVSQAEQVSTVDLSDLVVPGVKEAHDKVLHTNNGKSGTINIENLAKGIVKNGWSEEVVELATTLPSLPEKEGDEGVNTESEQYRIEQVVSQLQKLSKKKGQLEQFALDFAEAVFLSGGAKPKGVNDATYDALLDVGQELAVLRGASAQHRAPKSTAALLTLRELDHRLIEYTRSSDDIKASDYVALNAQHTEIARAIRSEEAKLLSKIPESFRAALEEWGLDTTENMYEWGQYKVDHLGKLREGKILREANIDERGPVVAYAMGNLDSAHYEATIPPRTRELISEEIWTEFKTKYSNKYESLGTAETRPEG